ncbi:hypothetical protein C8Q77DRAFT_1065670 [Trametes polyzona]|nr:hypothetical protein C8Q77DRAFT_1065670 [Trametes polyzona]
MAIRTRLSIGDILHRGLVWSLLGVSVWGIVMIGVVHRNTLQAGRASCYRQRGTCIYPTFMSSTDVLTTDRVQDEQNEISLAEAAQAALKGRSQQS